MNDPTKLTPCEPETFNIKAVIDQFGVDTGQTDMISIAAQRIMEKRNEIIDMFCQTFLAVQEAPTIEALRDLFSLVELECTMHDNLNQTFRLKLREPTPKKDGNNETM